MISEYEHEQWVETIWISFALPHARVMFTSPVKRTNDGVQNKGGALNCVSDSPSGCPSLANAAPQTKIGREDLNPRILVDRSQVETGFITRGLKKKRLYARVFWSKAIDTKNELPTSERGNVIDPLIPSSAPAE